MEQYRQYKPLFWLIGKFFITYILLTVLYSWYLNPYLTELKIADPFTVWVSDSVVSIMKFMGFAAENRQFDGEPFRRFYLEGYNCSIINEGCNAISIMIIYVSFVIAFGRKWIPTILFVVGGLILLHLTNLFRIALLNYIFTYYPEYNQLAHDILFPLIIYGMVIILWLIWVKFFVLKAVQDEA